MIVFNEVSFAYKNYFKMKKISFSLKDEKIYGILGANGAGKSTLLKMIFGFIVPDSGEISIFGKKVFRWEKKDLAKKIAYIPQNFDLQFDYKVKDIVLMGRFPYLESMRNYSKNDLSIVEDVIKKTNLSHLASKYFSKLSGGEKQRVSIARALAQQTDILLMDEAFANLDINYHQEIMQILISLNKYEHKTIIFVTHNINLAADYCDEIILMKKGDIIAINTPQNCLNADNIKNIYDAELQQITNPTTGKPNFIYKGRK